MQKISYFNFVSEIIKYKSINKASENLYVSQPYLSQKIKELEAELGFSLFHRSNKGVIPTERCLKALDYIEQIDQLIQQIGLLKYKVPPSEQETLTICCMHSFTFLNLFQTFSSLYASTQNHTFFRETDNDHVIDVLVKKEADLGIYYYTTSQEKSAKQYLQQHSLTFHPLYQEPCCIIVGKKHPLFHQQRVNMIDVQSYPFVVDNYKLRNFSNICSLFPESPIDPASFDNSRSAIYYIASSEKSFSIGQYYHNFHNPLVESDLLKFIPIIDTNLYSTTGYIIPSNKQPSALCKQYIEFITKYFSKKI